MDEVLKDPLEHAEVKPDSPQTNVTAVKKPHSKSSGQAENKPPLPKILFVGFVILVTLFALSLIANLLIKHQTNNNQANEITNYEECIAAGYHTIGIFPNISCVVTKDDPKDNIIFNQELTKEEVRKELYSKELGQGRFTNSEFSFEFPANTFELAYLACNYPDSEPALINKSTNNEYGKQDCPLAPYLFDVIKVDEIDESLSDASCYSTNKEQISIAELPATSYTAKFIGGGIDKCTEGMTGNYSDTDRLIYVKNENQLYLLKWPVLNYIDQTVYDEILSTFKFVNKTRTERIILEDDYWFDITLLPSYIININKTPTLTKEAAEIKNKNSDIAMKIVTNAGGEETRIGKTDIDGVPFYINYFEDIRCSSDLSATNWIPGTKPVFNIQIICD